MNSPTPFNPGRPRGAALPPTRLLIAVALLLLALAAVACGDPGEPTVSGPTRTPGETPDAGSRAPFSTVPGIVDPQNFGWPRTIETAAGVIEIPARPERIYSLSLGHAEIVAALRGGDVLVATAPFFKDPASTAAWKEFLGLPDAGSEPEQIISLDPEIVIASAFTSAELVEQLSSVGISVVRADLDDSALGNVPNVLLLGYMLGAEEEALGLAGQMTERLSRVAQAVGASASPQPRALALSRFSDIFVAGAGSTEGGIITAAGGLNVAAEDGISGHQQVGIEGIAALGPEIMLVTQPQESALEFIEELYADPALAEVPAVRDRRILYADPTFYTTLSHWNVRGIEESARLFYPGAFAGISFDPFMNP